MRLKQSVTACLCFCYGQVLIKWCIQRGVPALVKSERPERVEENFVGMYTWKLSYEQKVRLRAKDAVKDSISGCKNLAIAWCLLVELVIYETEVFTVKKRGASLPSSTPR